MPDKKIKERGLGRGLSALMSDVGVSAVVGDLNGAEGKKTQVNILKKTKSMLFINCNLYVNKNVIASATGVWKVIKKI